MADVSKTFVARRDELMVAIQDVLSPQLTEQPLTVEQHIKIQQIIAHYTADILGVEVTA